MAHQRWRVAPRLATHPLTGRHRSDHVTRAVLDDARAMVARGTAVLAATEMLRAETREDLDECVANDVDAALEAMPVEELRPYARGARLTELEGLTVADVVAGGSAIGVAGLGPYGARRVVAAANKVAQDVADRARVRLDADKRTPEHTAVLAQLAAIREADHASRDVPGFLDEVGPLMDDASVAATRFSAMFTSRAKRDRAADATQRLRMLLARPDVVELRGTLARARVAPESFEPDELWREYRADAASYNALLYRLAEYDADGVAAHGYVPDELGDSVEREPLDTTLLNATLRKYQVFGAQYVLSRRRVIIGDEMGLGKTIESLAVLAHLAAQGWSRFLVVCPASVQFNWLKEIAKHTQLDGFRLHGSQRDQERARWLESGGVAVTTFNTLARLELDDHPVDMLVVDEAHYVKNRAARRTAAVREVSDEAERVLFLTGTPLENRLEEFRNLVSYLQPEVATGISTEGPLTTARDFRNMVASVYLRRNQEDVLTELPEKIEVEDWILMSDSDRALYQVAVQAGNLMQMRQAAMRSQDSAKLERLKEIVAEARDEGRKVIVFSFFLRVLENVQQALGSVTVGPLTGSVTPSQRQALVDQFTARSGHAVLLSQVEAGGVGLNVQAASIVILVEPQWKPSTEQQAICRAHRMGQVHTVMVHRLLTKDSVDERLQEIQQGKIELFDAYARPSDAKDASPQATQAALADHIIAAEQHRLGV